MLADYRTIEIGVGVEKKQSRRASNHPFKYFVCRSHSNHLSKLERIKLLQYSSGTYRPAGGGMLALRARTWQPRVRRYLSRIERFRLQGDRLLVRRVQQGAQEEYDLCIIYLYMARQCTRSTRPTSMTLHRKVPAAATRGITFQLVQFVRNHQNQIAPQDFSVSSTKKASRSGVDIILSIAYNICRPLLDHL